MARDDHKIPKRRKNLTWGRASRDRRGRIGAMLEVRCEARGRGKTYRILTHGMTPEAVAAKIDALNTAHERRIAKLEDLQSLVGPLSNRGATITDAIIRDRGQEVEAFIQAVDAEGKPIEGFPLRVPAVTVDELPDVEEIRRRIEDMIEVPRHNAADHARFVRRVRELRGEE
jgi:hypothetical protein